MVDKLKRGVRSTLGADKSYQQERFVHQLRARRVQPHVAEYAPNPKWPNWLTEDERSGDGFRISQKKRKLVEEPFGWAKTIGGLARPMLRGAKRLSFKFTLTMAAYDLIRLPKLIGAVA